MNLDPIQLAAEAIRRAGKEHPADEVLRKLFLEKRRRDPRSGKTSPGPGLRSLEATQAVFNYYRWLGWLADNGSLETQIREANDLAHQFRTRGAEFSDEELLARAVPAWTSEEVALSPQLVRALQMEPKLWLRARKGCGPATSQVLGDCTPFGAGPLADILQYHGAQDLFRTPEYFAGDFQIQDINSQAVGFLCAPKPGETWWDACAGEGGKTLHLSELMENKGLIWASDRADWRLKKLRTRAGRAKVFNYRAVGWDGGAKPPTRTLFDGVLVDAPCSGVGTWQRNPHARWTTTLEDIRELAALQFSLLTHVAGSLKPGGRLIYSVCSLAKSETDAVADQFQQRFPIFEPLAAPNPLRPNSPPAARHWLLPQDFGGNGMFVALWKKV